jgi:hypothetical protein
MRRLPLFQVVPTSRLRILLGIGILLWVALCAKFFTDEIRHPTFLGIGVSAAVVFAPLLLTLISRIPMFLLMAYVALVPLNDLMPTHTGASVLKLLAIVLAAALVLSMIAKQRTSTPSRAVFAWLVATAYLGATTFWAIDSMTALTAYAQSCSFVLLYVVLALYPIEPRDMKLVLACALGGALAAVLYGELAFHQSPLNEGARLYIGNADIGIDPNFFASSLLLPISLALVLFLQARRILTKFLWFVALAALFGGFVISGSRGAGIAMVAIVVFVLWRLPYKRELGLLVLSAFIVTIGSPLGQRLMSSDVTSGDGRFDIWKVGIASLRQYWLQGAGVGNFNEAFNQYFLAVPHQPLAWDRVSHSTPLQLAVECGIFGLLLIMGAWFFIFRELADERGDDLIVAVCTGVRAGILGLFVAGFSINLLWEKYTWLAFSLSALMYSALHYREERMRVRAASREAATIRAMRPQIET